MSITLNSFICRLAKFYIYLHSEAFILILKDTFFFSIGHTFFFYNNMFNIITVYNYVS